MLFIKASGVQSESTSVKASLLVNLIGSDGFDVYQTFTFEKEADRDDVNVLLEKFDAYFGTKVNITLMRYKFFTRNQETGESIQQYVTALRLLSKNCEFGNLAEELIKDRIVCGLRDSRVRDRLLRCDDLNLDKAVKLCQAEEVSQESERQISATGVGTSVAHVDGVALEGRSAGQRWRGRSGAAGGARGGGSGGARAALGAGGRARAAPACRSCGGARCPVGRCPAAHVTCYVCGKVGHFARVCRSNIFNSGNVKKVYEIGRQDSDASSDECESFYISMINCEENTSSSDWCEIMKCGNGFEKFKLDTGADINVLSYRRFKRLGFHDTILRKKNVHLQSYTGNVIPVKGICNLHCVYKNNNYNLEFAIADLSCESVLGHKTCAEIGLVKRVNLIELSKYDDLFSGVGCLPGKYHIVVDNSVKPTICASRKVPLGLRDRLADELKNMENMNIIRKVTYPTDWVHPLVLVAKKDNGIRVCLDPRELNRAVQRAHFQLPTVTELATQLRGARFFSVLDANSGFWAVQLDEESADLCTFATPFGRYQFLRLPFGINCASEVFHSKMRQLLEDLEGTDSFVDDIVVWGRTRVEHDKRLIALLERARQINLKFNKKKCKLGVQEVTYLGHVFDANGMRPDYNKVKAIMEIKQPKDRKDLERFLGAVNYLSKFIPNYSEHAIPLNNLLKKENSWRWENSEQCAFDKLKKCVSSAPCLALYDVSRPVVLSVDAASDALGAVLLQDGRPVEFASRTLTDAQRRYAQVEKELLAIVFACERFHQYIFGKNDILVESDHKPLESIFKKPLMSVPARLQRMLLRIQGYDLKVNYKPGKLMYIPDTLSRAPLADTYSEELEKNVLYQVQLVVNNLPMSNKRLIQIKNETKKDITYNKLLEYIKQGWPFSKYEVDQNLRMYWSLKNELYVVDDVIFKDNTVLIPPALRAEMLRVVHEGHQGIDRCKRRARQVIFWPSMGRDIELYVRRCSVCQECSHAPAREPMIPISIPTLPWQKVGSDIFEYGKKYYLVLVDYFSNYVEVCKLNNISSRTVIDNMKEIFARHGIPEFVFSDNGTQYSSREFKQFADDWGFQHVTSSPNYPQSNGKSERAVQTIKNMLIKSIKSGSDFQVALLNYRNTPRDGLSSPAQMLMSRRLRCKLPNNNYVLVPKLTEPKEYYNMLQKQKIYKANYDKCAKPATDLNNGDNVIVIDGKNRSRGIVVSKANTPRSYIVENTAGIKYRRNRRHLIKCERLSSEINVNNYKIQKGELDGLNSSSSAHVTSASEQTDAQVGSEPKSGAQSIQPQRPWTRSWAKKMLEID